MAPFPIMTSGYNAYLADGEDFYGEGELFATEKEAYEQVWNHLMYARKDEGLLIMYSNEGKVKKEHIMNKELLCTITRVLSCRFVVTKVSTHETEKSY